MNKWLKRSIFLGSTVSVLCIYGSGCDSSIIHDSRDDQWIEQQKNIKVAPKIDVENPDSKKGAVIAYRGEFYYAHVSETHNPTSVRS